MRKNKNIINKYFTNYINSDNILSRGDDMKLTLKQKLQLEMKGRMKQVDLDKALEKYMKKNRR